MLNKVTSALKAMEGFPGMTVTGSRRFLRGRNLTERRALRIDGSGEKVCVEIVTPDEKARQIVETFVGAARTNISGDGKVYVLPVDSAVHNQAGEIDDRRSDALLTLLIFNDFRVFQLASNR
ncbi:MAG: P-II family nitrogen regulator [Blastocatellia bacterium]